ncbi:MAG: inositol monophosphatase [Planctomycetes bacterium]|nr:inositol monophosphatase [Planctomycetota bacterium]
MHAPVPQADAHVRDRLDLLLQVAEQAAELTRSYFQSDRIRVESKSDESPVTQADREAEQLIRGAVKARFPGDGFLGEEFGRQPGGSGFDWVIDPIDGTVSFAAGVPLYGSLIGIEHTAPDGTRRVVAGVASMPALRERVWAVQGGGAWWERQGMPRVPARVCEPRPFKDCIACTTGVEYYRRTDRMGVLRRLEETFGRMRGWSDCYSLVLLATGRCQVALDPMMNPWDCGPFPVIIAEAGGVFTSWKGEPGIHGGDSVACHPAMHEELLRLLRG